MSGKTAPDFARVENILRTVDLFKPVSTRRAFMGKLLAAGGGVAVASSAGALSSVIPALASGTSFPDAAVGAERIAIAFYGNALGVGSPFGTPSDLAKGRLLNFAHREYFQAAMSQEQVHLSTLQTLLAASFPVSVFAFPAGTFDSASAMLAFGEKIEDIFIGAYLGAILATASAGQGMVAEAAAQIVGVECEHRVLIRDIAMLTPPNDRNFEGTSLGADGTGTATSSNGSTVYASGDEAVVALLALGITPS